METNGHIERDSNPNSAETAGALTNDILQAIETATEGSDKLNYTILIAVGWRRIVRADGPDKPTWAVTGRDWKTPNGWCAHDLLPDVTRSIDAALSLVPEGWRLHDLRQYDEGWWCKLVERRRNDHATESFVKGENAGARAITAAALRIILK